MKSARLLAHGCAAAAGSAAEVRPPPLMYLHRQSLLSSLTRDAAVQQPRAGVLTGTPWQ